MNLLSIQTLFQEHTIGMIFACILIVMIPFIIFYLKESKSHPKGLIAAALSNMGERFGYYIMNAAMTLFICSKFGLDDKVAGLIYAVFLFLIYVLSLPGGVIADKLQNYKGTIITGLIVMAAGYALLSIPTTVNSSNATTLLVFICVALFIIAFGNGLFKGNLQALVGQLYDNFEAEAAAKGPEALAKAKSKREPGFQIFYVFINIGGVIAPFVVPAFRNWILGMKDMVYNAQLPKLCHQFIDNAGAMTPEQMNNLNELMAANNHQFVAGADMAQACASYLDVFNTGIHYSFIASICAMLISLVIFLCTKHKMPNPAKKVKSTEAAVSYTAEERAAMAKDIKQRMLGLYAVLGICVFFWMAFHQNAESLSFFARDFVNTDTVAPEIMQCVNPGLVILLTPVLMIVFATAWGKKISTPRKIALGMGIAACAYLFLMIFSIAKGYPSGEAFLNLPVAESSAMKGDVWVMLVTYFFLTVAELFISPLGLSFVSKIAPKHIQGICQGLWLSATAVGNLLILLGPIFYNKLPKLWMCWLVFLAVCAVAMFIMLGMVKWLERVTAGEQAAVAAAKEDAE